MKLKIILIFLLVFFSFTLTNPVSAADILSRITHNDQYALVLGQVTKVRPSSFEMSIVRAISGHPISGRIMIKSAATAQIKHGDKLLISLGRGKRGYQIHWGWFEVTSLEPKKVKIIDSIWPKGDLAALEHYIHTNGAEHEFFFIADSAFVRYTDGTFTRLYPELPVNQRTQHFKIMICPIQQDYRPADFQTPGIGLDVSYYRNRDDDRFEWETNYGEFSLRSPDNQVTSLGTTSTVKQWQTVYWTPSLTQKAIPKEGIKITVTAVDLKTQKRYEQTHIEIQFKEEGFEVKL